VREDQIVDKLIQNAVASVFNRHFSVRDFDRLFEAGETFLVSLSSASNATTMRIVAKV
jgi:hypothetical protein